MSQGIAGKIAIIGVGTTRFGELFEQTYNDLVVEATFEAYNDAGVTGNDIEAAWLGCYLPTAWGYDGTGGPALAEALKEGRIEASPDAVALAVHRTPTGVATTRVEPKVAELLEELAREPGSLPEELKPTLDTLESAGLIRYT